MWESLPRQSDRPESCGSGSVPYLPGSEQPHSQFVFRLSDQGTPAFKIVEAEGGIWKNEAVDSIKEYFRAALAEMPEEIRSRIVIIG